VAALTEPDRCPICCPHGRPYGAPCLRCDQVAAGITDPEEHPQACSHRPGPGQIRLGDP